MYLPDESSEAETEAISRNQQNTGKRSMVVF